MVEVIVVVAVIGFLFLCVLMALPKGRETARQASCQQNLRQIGEAVLGYDQAHRRYPGPPPAGEPGNSPIEAMLRSLDMPDFRDLGGPKPPQPSGAPGRGARVAGLLCPSDAAARPGRGMTELSYRANAGGDFAGSDGPFAFGAAVGSKQVEEADGLSFTAGFAERLLGSGKDGEATPGNYALVPGPVTSRGLPPAGPSRWRGDAGADWADAGWRSAVYTHAAPPNAPATAIAEDGRTANVTGSSAHPGRVNVWMLDGSFRGIAATVDPAIWRAMGGYRSAPPPAPAGTAP